VRTPAADPKRHDRVGVAGDDKRRHVDLGEVPAEVGVGERGDAVKRPLRRGEGRDLSVAEPGWLADQVGAIARGTRAWWEQVG
jgi:hypothetical protein